MADELAFIPVCHRLQFLGQAFPIEREMTPLLQCFHLTHGPVVEIVAPGSGLLESLVGSFCEAQVIRRSAFFCKSFHKLRARRFPALDYRRHSLTIS
jgi:hypothetical protein